jgi:hypothetical protein
MTTLHSIPVRLESLLSTLTEQPLGLYVAVGIVVFLCYMVAYEFDAMFSRH